MPLLNYYSQTKMAKGEQFGYKTAILHLAPFDLSGKNVCPKASPECAAACLNTSGRGQMGSVQKARINKTNLFWTNKNAFLQQLSLEIEQLKKRIPSLKTFAGHLAEKRDESRSKGRKMSPLFETPAFKMKV